MAYEVADLPLQTLLPAVARAEDQLARLDEVVRRSPVGEGFIERGHFFDSAASMWVAGELVHIEDLVLHDAHMDVRTPTHELTIAHTIVRSRRRIASSNPDWAFGEAGIAALTGAGAEKRQDRPDHVAERAEEGDDEIADDDGDALSREFADIDAILDRSQRLIDRLVEDDVAVAASNRPSLVVGDLVIRDPDWDEQDRLQQWRQIIKQSASVPSALGAALIYDAWEDLEPMQRQHWLGGQLASAYLRSRRKVTSHLLAFNVGLKAVPRERRRAQNRTTRLLAFLDAMSAAADLGMKDIARLSQAREQLERKLRGRRSSSSLPSVIDLILARPVVSAAMIAKTAKVTPRGALNLIADLGVREMTGRGRYRAWGVI
ncbi:RHE_PE00001 family protein [Pelagibacterium luteolum]|uniref:HTH DNA binding domain-containing protein n=1 Tax=Pelagibacterium luteolum TaxID=440168 RepID=A0A1G7YQH0_9HYPH|nr:RHE_PE00001 family protein [Pelagibacterium luteolum]SDG98657.1 HTH DNA binding domain-containing protein [Pelagibacterium luteolum]